MHTRRAGHAAYAGNSFRNLPSKFHFWLGYFTLAWPMQSTAQMRLGWKLLDGQPWLESGDKPKTFLFGCFRARTFHSTSLLVLYQDRWFWTQSQDVHFHSESLSKVSLGFGKVYRDCFEHARPFAENGLLLKLLAQGPNQWPISCQQ